MAELMVATPSHAHTHSHAPAALAARPPESAASGATTMSRDLPNFTKQGVAAIYASKELRAVVDALQPAAIHAHILSLQVHSSSVGPASDRNLLRESFVVALAESARLMRPEELRGAVEAVACDARRRADAPPAADAQRCAALMLHLHISEADEAAAQTTGAAADSVSPQSGMCAASAVASSGAYMRDRFNNARDRIPAFDASHMHAQQEQHDSDDDALLHLQSVSQREESHAAADGAKPATAADSGRSWPAGGRHKRWSGLKLWSRRTSSSSSSPEHAPEPSGSAQPEHKQRDQDQHQHQQHEDDALYSSASSDGGTGAGDAERFENARRESCGSACSHSTASTAGSEFSDAHRRARTDDRRRRHSSAGQQQHLSRHGSGLHHSQRLRAHRRCHSSSNLLAQHPQTPRNHRGGHHYSAAHGRPHHRSGGIKPRSKSKHGGSSSSSHHHSPHHHGFAAGALWRSVSVDNLVGFFRRRKHSHELEPCPQIKSILKPACRVNRPGSRNSNSGSATGTSASSGSSGASAPGSSGRARRRRFLHLPFGHHHSSEAPDAEAESPDAAAVCDKHVRFGTCRMISQTGEVVGCMQLCGGDERSDDDDEEEEEEENEEEEDGVGSDDMTSDVAPSPLAVAAPAAQLVMS